MTARPVPTAEGEFARTPFAHVLLYVRERGLTGTLAIQCEASAGDMAGESLIGLEAGGITQVKLPVVTEPLGFVLREQGVINDAQLTESLSRLATRESLQGEILVRMGACDGEAIDRALVEQLRRHAVRFFTGVDASYQYYDALNLLEGWGARRVRDDVFAVIARGLRAFPEQPAIEPVLARVANHRLKLRTGAADLRLFEFDRAEQGMIDLLRHDAQPLDALLRAGGSPQSARAMIYLLLVSKQIESAGAAAGRTSIPARAPAERVSAPPLSAVPPAVANSARRSVPDVVTEAPTVPPEHREKYAEAEKRLAAMENENYFEMLGVPTSVGNDAVREAFLQLAARWHPDRSPSGADALHAVYQRIFAHLSEAQETLSNDEMRGRYFAAVQDGGGTPNAQRKMAAMIEAATDAQKAEVCLKRREYDEAERLARHALSVTEDPNAMATLAAVLLERRADAPVDEPLTLLRRAIAMVPRHDRAHVMLGTIYKRRGDGQRAMEHFRLALQANARNVDAAREVRLAEMRARDSGRSAPVDETGTRAKGREGLFSKLLKK